MSDIRGKTIFVVEDKMENRVVYQLALIKFGIKLVFDRWGRGSTIALMKEQKHLDLIILDLMLPNGLSGFEIFDDIRSDTQFDNVPIIAISAMDVSVALPRVKEKGFDGFIAKPINEELFPRQITKVMNGEKIWISDNY